MWKSKGTFEGRLNAFLHYDLSRYLLKPGKCGGLSENDLHRLICLTTWSQIGGCLGMIGRLEVVGGDVSLGSNLHFKSSHHSQLIHPLCFLFVDQDVALSHSHNHNFVWTLVFWIYKLTKCFLAFALVMAFCHSNRKLRHSPIIFTWFTLAVQKFFIIYEWECMASLDLLSSLLIL